MEFLSQTYVALRGPTGAQQTPTDAIVKLSDRLSPATLLADRRAAVLSLKGLSRDCSKQVGERALPGLLEVLANDAEVDADIGKAVLETLNMLCRAEQDASPTQKEIGLRHTDHVLANEKATHTLFTLLSDANFYTRLSTLQFLSTLLLNRRQLVQGYFLTLQEGARSVISLLEDKREIIRSGESQFAPSNAPKKMDTYSFLEAISLVQSLISQSPNIQKILAFEGAFERLFKIITQEGGIDGGVVAQGALRCVEGLLRHNPSNQVRDRHRIDRIQSSSSIYIIQSYFGETPFPPTLCALLLFPPDIQLDVAPPQEFSLQFWDDQKLTNATLVVGIMGLLLGTKGGDVCQSQAIISENV
jgi:intracellular protein transport protein USO1